MDTSGVIETKNGIENVPEKPANEYVIHHEISPRRYPWRKVPSILKISGTIFTRVMPALYHIWRCHFMKRKKEHLEQSIGLSRHFVFEHGYDVYFKLDTGGVIIIISPSVKKRFGYDPEELIGKPVRMYCRNPEDHFLILKKLSERKMVNDYIMVVLKKDGAEVTISLNAQAIIDANGDMIAMEGIVRDINEHVCLHNALQKANMELIGFLNGITGGEHPKNVNENKKSPSLHEMVRSIEESWKFIDAVVDGVPDIIYRLDIDGKIIFINKAVINYGYEIEEIIGRNALDFVHPEDRDKVRYRMNERRTGKRCTESLEIRLLRKNGRREELKKKAMDPNNVPVFLLNATGIYASEEPNTSIFMGTQGIARDITERKEAEESLNRRLRAEEFNASISTRFININHKNVDHEIINTLSGLCEFLGVDVGTIYKASGDGEDVILKYYHIVGDGHDIWTPVESYSLKTYPWMRSLLMSQEYVQCASRSDIPSEAYQERLYFTAARIKSFYSFPIFYGGFFYGMIEIYTVRNEKKLANEDIRLLQTLGQIIVNALKRKEYEINLRKFVEAIERSSEAIFMTDLGGLITYINPAFTNLYGYTEEEALANTPRILKSGRIKAEAYEQFWREILTKNDVSCELENQTKCGNIVFVDSSINPLLDDDNELVGFIAAQRDITERKLAAELVIQSERKFRSIFRAAPISIWEVDLMDLLERLNHLRQESVVDFDHYLQMHPEFTREAANLVKVKDFNDETLKIFGANDKKHLFESLHKIISCDVNSAFMSLLRAMWQNNRFFEAKEIQYRLDGMYIPILVRLNLPGKCEEFKSIIVTVMDISVHEKAAEAIKASELKYRSLTQSATDGIISIDHLGNIIAWNIGATRLFGYTESEVMGSAVTCFMPERFKMRHLDGMTRFLEIGESPIIGEAIELLGKRKDGSEFPMELTISFWQQNGDTFYTGIVRDITAKKRVEHELLEERHKLERMLKYKIMIADIASKLNIAEGFQNRLGDIFEDIYESLHIPFVFICGFEYAPPVKYFRYFGDSNGHEFSYDELINCRWIFEKVKIDGRCIIENDGELSETENVNLEKIGLQKLICVPVKLNEISIGIMGFGNSGNESWWFDAWESLCTIADLIGNAWERESLYRARLEAERKHLEAATTAERSSRLASLGTLAAGIAHEINQPLNAIRIKVDGSLFWKEKKAKKLSDNLESTFRFISEQVGRINEIIEQMRVLAKQDPAKSRELVDVNQEINKAISLMEQRLSAHGIQAVLRLRPSTPRILGHPTQIQQVVLNILLNSLNVLDTLVKQDKKIMISTGAANENCIVRISDNGPGIPEENLNRIFDPFFTTMMESGGMGLGLSIVQNIVEAMNGTIKAENNVEGGANFLIAFPSYQNEERESR